MPDTFKLTTVLLYNIFKWIFLAVIVGILVGLSTTVFLKMLDYSTAFIGQFPFYFLFLPLGLIVSILLTRYLAPDAAGHGTEKVVEAIHKNSGKINANVIPVKLLATIITITSGGSVGKEGPCAQIGAGVTSLFADIFKLNDQDRKKLVICGVSAGFAAVFGTPIAGAIFGVEVLFVGSILYDVLLPSFVSAIVSYHLAAALGIGYFYKSVHIFSANNGLFLLTVLAAGVFFGVCALLFIQTLDIFKSLSRKLKIGEPVKGLAGGLIIAALALVFSTQYLGLGIDTIHKALAGEKLIWYAFLLKMLLTSLTLNAGGSGGVVTPIFFIGAAAGNIFAQFFNLDIPLFSALGFVSVLAGAANTPIAASIMAIEVFGSAIAPYACLACVISFLLTGYKSVYPSQILSAEKTLKLKAGFGEQIEEKAARFDAADNKVIILFSTVRTKIKNMFGNKN